MARASFTLRNGTLIAVEGTSEDIQEPIEFYGGPVRKPPKNVDEKSSQATDATKIDKFEPFDLVETANTIKSCGQAEAIKNYVLDRRNEANRVLLPLFVVYEHLDNVSGPTTRSAQCI